MFKNDCRFLPYYYARYVGLYIAYGLIYILVIMAPADLIILVLEDFFNISYLSDAIEWIALTLTGIILCREVLGDVFFKSYKTFKLSPKISRITYGFSTIYLVCNLVATEISKYAVDSIFKKLATNDFIYLATEIVLVFVDAMVLRFFVNRFASIEAISDSETNQ